MSPITSVSFKRYTLSGGYILPMFGYCTNMVDLKTLNLHGVSPTTLILSESIQNMDHLGVSPITTVFFDKEIRVIEIHPDLRLSQL